MTRRLIPVMLVVVGALLLPASARAQRVDLTVTPGAFTFPSADPDTTPAVVSPALTIRYRVQQNRDAQWRITLLANGNLQDGEAAIPIERVTWSATPAPPFQNGSLSSAVERLLASGTGNVPTSTGSITFQLGNSWDYAAGLYTQTFVFTISAP